MKVVLSASRRTDLVAYYPDRFIEAMNAYPPERVHTVVIWTKNPSNLLNHRELNALLRSYDQLYVHFTITGMGGTLIEPGTPPMKDMLQRLPEVVAFVGRPERVRVRFDPVVNLLINGEPYSNIQLYSKVAAAAHRVGIPSITTSWMQMYKKVARRFEARGIRTMPFGLFGQYQWMQGISVQYGLTLHVCSVQGLPMSRCIDGELLTRLHPRGEYCSWERARDQRPLCGCTRSVDIGWYSQVCPGGCLYCYATPEDVHVQLSNFHKAFVKYSPSSTGASEKVRK